MVAVRSAVSGCEVGALVLQRCADDAGRLCGGLRKDLRRYDQVNRTLRADEAQIETCGGQCVEFSARKGEHAEVPDAAKTAASAIRSHSVPVQLTSEMPGAVDAHGGALVRAFCQKDRMDKRVAVADYKTLSVDREVPVLGYAQFCGIPAHKTRMPALHRALRLRDIAGNQECK